MKLKYQDCDGRNSANDRVGNPKVIIEMTVDEMMKFSAKTHAEKIDQSIKILKNTLTVIENLKYGDRNPYMKLDGVVRLDINIDNP
jgi:phosphopantetheine adenylyltransferase